VNAFGVYYHGKAQAIIEEDSCDYILADREEAMTLIIFGNI